MNSPRARAILAAILSTLVALGVVVTVVDNGPDHQPDKPRRTVTITIGQGPSSAPTPEPGGVPQPTQPTVTGPGQRALGDPDRPLAPAAIVDPDDQVDPGQAAKQDDLAAGPDTHEDARDETPPGVSPAEADRIEDGQARGLVEPRPPAGAQNYSCKYRPVVNQSSRNGARVQLLPLHYTVSRNVPGWGDVNVIWGLFNTRSFNASSTLIIDFEGNCLRLMADSAKPWTQGSFNPVSVSVEIIAMGTETRADWLRAPLIRDGILAALWRDEARKNGIPLRRVDPVGCGVQQAGWTDHFALECGNNHHDVTPAFPYDVFAKQLRAGATATGRAALTKGERASVDCLAKQRRKGRRPNRRGGGWKGHPLAHRKAIQCRTKLQRGVAFYKAHPQPRRALRAERRRYLSKVLAR